MSTIVFASDYGRADPFVGMCHAVVARIAPDVRVVDLSHDITPHDVRHGAVVLADAAPYLPPGVVLAVVDPGVGTTRRPVVVAAGEFLLVGPDNGLLWPLSERLGDLRGAWEVTERRYLLEPVSLTFHGRDVFSPAAALLAAGLPPSALGPAIDIASLQRLTLPVAEIARRRLSAEVLQVDRFGNLQLAASAPDLGRAGLAVRDAVRVSAGDRTATALVCHTFADLGAGDMGVLADAFGRVQVAVNQGNAAAALDGRPGQVVAIRSTVG